MVCYKDNAVSLTFKTYSQVMPLVLQFIPIAYIQYPYVHFQATHSDLKCLGFCSYINRLQQYGHPEYMTVDLEMYVVNALD